VPGLCIYVTVSDSGPSADVRALVERLAKLGLEGRALDAGHDLAEQLDELLGAGTAGPVLFYANANAVVGESGELFLCVDAADPTAGDALADLCDTLRERVSGPLMIVLECRHGKREDPFAGAAYVAAAREAVAPTRSGVELFVAAHPSAFAPSSSPEAAPLARALGKAIDALARPLSGDDLYRVIEEESLLLGEVQGFARARGRVPFVLEAPVPEAQVPASAPSGEGVSHAQKASVEPALAAAPVSVRGPRSERRGTLVGGIGPDVAAAVLAAQTRRSSAPPAAPSSDVAAGAGAELAPSAPSAAVAAPSPEPATRAEAPLPRPPREPSLPEIPVELAGDLDEGAGHDVDFEVEQEVEHEVEHEAEPEVPVAARAPSPTPDKPVSRVIPSAPPAPVAKPPSSPPAREAAPASAKVSFGPTAVPSARAPSERAPEARVMIQAPTGASSPPPPPDAQERGRGASPSARPSTRPPPAKSEPAPSVGAGAAPAKREAPESRAIVTEPATREPSEAAGPSAPPPGPRAASVPPPAPAAPEESAPLSADDEGDMAALEGRHEEALLAYKRALGALGSSDGAARASLHERIGRVRVAQGKRREAIASFEKALALGGEAAPLLAKLLELNLQEGDRRAIITLEDKLLTLVSGRERPQLLRLYAERWREGGAEPDLARARELLEAARELSPVLSGEAKGPASPSELALLADLAAVFDALGNGLEAFAALRQRANLTADARARAGALTALAERVLAEKRGDELALELFEQALEAEPRELAPLATVATLLAERQEWSELEQAYRRMLKRLERLPEGSIRSDVTWELSKRLGLLFRDHLEDARGALEAFEAALREHPSDLPTREAAAALALSLGELERAKRHLVASTTSLSATPGGAPTKTFHQLFEVFQKLRLPDLALGAAEVTVLRGEADQRETFVHQELDGVDVAKPLWPLRPEAWDLLLPADMDPLVDDILAAVAPAALGALAELVPPPSLDARSRQDPQRSTASAVRSMVWASHFLSVPLPHLYVVEDPERGLRSVLDAESTVLLGGAVTKGRKLGELAFLVGQHLAYHLGPASLLLHVGSIDELSAMFLAAVTVVLREVPVPPRLYEHARVLRERIEHRLDDEARGALELAVRAFDRGGSRADLGAWVAANERAAARAGLLLAGRLDTAARLLRAPRVSARVRGEPLGLLEPAALVTDLEGFLVSDGHTALRKELGVALEP
jgi:tetratricopeptide (TPR) repeat protein